MTDINWRQVQQRLVLKADGIPGRNTYAALFRLVGQNAGVGRLNALGTAAAVHFPAYGIDASAARLADMMAQTANETGGYTVFEENLNYSAEALTRTWPKRFPLDKARIYANKPRMIAIAAYGDRMGNATPEEGWTFRGRGMLQLTGRANYEAADRRLGLGLTEDPDLAARPALSLLIACDFYRQNKVLAALDAGDAVRARAITNGGGIGLANVEALRRKVLAVLT